MTCEYILWCVCVFIASQDDGGWPAKRLVAGTPLYMSPRVHSGRPASPACDLVSLGFAMARMGEHGLPWAHEGFVDTVFGCFFLCLKKYIFWKKKKKRIQGTYWSATACTYAQTSRKPVFKHCNFFPHRMGYFLFCEPVPLSRQTRKTGFHVSYCCTLGLESANPNPGPDFF
jgi:hypothetical protein